MNDPTPLPGPERLQALLQDWFAPWVQQLGLRLEHAEPGLVRLRLPFAEALTRIGGMVCGQALMAAADTAMALAVASQAGERPMTTVQLSTSFLKPLAGQDALVSARVLRAGKSLVFVEVDIVTAGDGRSVCRVSSTYALL